MIKSIICNNNISHHGADCFMSVRKEAIRVVLFNLPAKVIKFSEVTSGEGSERPRRGSAEEPEKHFLS